MQQETVLSVVHRSKILRRSSTNVWYMEIRNHPKADEIIREKMSERALNPYSAER